MANTLDKVAPNAVDILDVDNNVTITGTTAFVDNAVVTTTETRTKLTDADIGPTKLDNNGIADFLAKPRIIASGSFLGSNAVGDILYTSSISSALTSQTLWLDKLKGYNLVRGTACVKIVFNANPFQAGRLILSFLPCYKHLLTSNSHYGRMKRGTINQVTVNPNVEMDLKDSSMEMEIPYNTPYAFFDIAQDLYDWGTIWLQVLSPLKTGPTGPTFSDYVIYLSFKDVELSAPTFAPEADNTTGIPSGTSKRVLRKEQKMRRNKGFFEDTLDKVGDVGEILSDVPVIGGVADFVGGVANIGSAISSIFGWSKPVSAEEIKPMIHQPFRGMQNINGSVGADALSAGNLVTIEPNVGVVGAENDEMSFAHLKAIPMLVDRFTIAQGQSLGHIYMSRELNYDTMSLNSTITTGTKSYRQSIQPPFVYLANAFTSWRGSLKLTLKFVKTNFHSGRIVVGWSPTPSASIGAAFVNNTAFVMREIVDLRTTEEITLVLPYIKPSNYIAINEPINGTSSAQRSFGYLSIGLANPLIFPETVDNEIECLMYLSAGDDLEYANYCGPRAFPFVAEGGGEQYKMIGSAEKPKQTLAHNVASSGDILLSVKQLMAISQLMRFNFPVTLPVGIYGYAMGVMRPSGTGPLMPPIFGDTMNFYSLGYTYMRGGVRLTSAGENNTFNGRTILARTANPAIYGAPPSDNVPVSYFDFTGQANFNTPQQSLDVIRVGVSGRSDAVIPFYSQVPLRLIDVQSSDFAAKQGRIDVYQYQCIVTSDNPTPGTEKIYRSGADDYSVHYFTGFPPLLLGWNTA